MERMENDWELIRQALNDHDEFCKANGIELTVARPGYAEAVLPITEQMLNGVRTVQGGAIFTLCDLAFAGASNTYGFRCVALSGNISYVRPGTGSGLKAVATEVSRGRRTGVYRVDVFNDAGKLVAASTITGFISEERILKP